MNLVEDDYIMNIYTQMKQRHGIDTIILFHVGDYYEAYIEDSQTLSEVLHLPRKLKEVHSEYVVYVTWFLATRLSIHLSTLHRLGYAVCVSEMCAPDGTHILKITDNEQK